MELLERRGKESSREYALRVITYNIINLALAPGSKVSESELSALLGLSRTPIREALLELEKTGIVEILPQRGSRVALIDYDLVEETRFLRLVLERAIVELACTLSDELDFTALDENLRFQQFCVEQNWADKLLELDNDFHRELFHLCNKQRTFQLMNALTAHFDRVRALALCLGPAKDMKTVDDHILLATAIRQKDAQQAVALMETHLSRYKFDATQIQKKFPAYFE